MNKNMRHIHHINPDIQNRLIISFVIFELALISLALFYLYMDMNQIIENNMFRSHIQQPLDVKFFAIRLLQSAAILLIINLAIASFIVWRWRSYVYRIVQPLDDIIDAMEQLDFSHGLATEKNHQALLLAEDWLTTEKNRFREIRMQLLDLDINQPQATMEKLQQARQLINQ